MPLTLATGAKIAQKIGNVTIQVPMQCLNDQESLVHIFLNLDRAPHFRKILSSPCAVIH